VVRQGNHAAGRGFAVSVPSARAGDPLANPRVAYFVQDLNDPAVARRVRMFVAGGLDVIVFGFWRGDPPPSRIDVADVIALGRTFDARLGQRALLVLKHSLADGRIARLLRRSDIVVARNLEMLAIAVAAGRRAQLAGKVKYEVLDVHRLLLAPSLVGRMLRHLERRLTAHSDMLLVSSQAFVREYFERQFARQGRRPQTLLIENKLFGPQPPAAASAPVTVGPPWRIGWFGMLRCQRSLDILCSLAARRPELVQVTIAGRPAKSAFRDFDAQVAAARGVTYSGPYRPSDLPALYSGIHLNWAVDYFEEGGNSEWLLPNRLYEGGHYNAVPLALRRTETGRWLQGRNLGILLDDPQKDLESTLERLDGEKFDALKAACAAAERSLFVTTPADCEEIARRLRSAQNSQSP
jgi:succinoglycan biosynthesis protein ExoL